MVAGPAHRIVFLQSIVPGTWWPGAGGEVRVVWSADTAGAPGRGWLALPDLRVTPPALQQEVALASKVGEPGTLALRPAAGLAVPGGDDVPHVPNHVVL